MHRGSRDNGNETNLQRRSRRGFGWACWSTTLLTCLSCSSGDGAEPAPTSSESASIAQSQLAGHGGPPSPGNSCPGGPGHGRPGHGGPGHHCGGAGSGGAPGAGGASGNGGEQPATGGAQSGNGGASAGGVSGNRGEPLGSFTLSTPRLDFGGCPRPQTVVITNTSSVPLTWHASITVLQGDSMNPNFPFRIAVSPLGSTLAPGAAVDLSIVPGVGVTSFAATLSIDADVAPSQAVNLVGSLTPTVIPPPDIDFGNVPLGSASQISISGWAWSFTYPGERMSSSNPDFALDGPIPIGGSWLLTFRPRVLGPQQTTLSFFSLTGSCPPDSFIARGTGVAP